MSDILAMTMTVNEIPLKCALDFVAALRREVIDARNDTQRLRGKLLGSKPEPCDSAELGKEVAKLVKDLWLNEQRPGGILNPTNPKPQIKVVMLRPLAPKPESNCPRTTSSFEEGHSVGVELRSGSCLFEVPWQITHPDSRAIWAGLIIP